MSIVKKNRTHMQEELERRILRGLLYEWDAALWVLDAAHKKLMKRPFISIRNMQRKLGHWSGDKKEICLSRDLVYNHSWDAVREVLLHEIAHQFAEEALGAVNEPPHGALFQKACHLLRANPKSSGKYKPLHEKIFNNTLDPKDKIMLRIRKLLALAESKNRHEAEAAMLKAHGLIKKYNIDLLYGTKNRNFISVFIGRPALRHSREAYYIAHLIQDFYFVQGIWVAAYVLEKSKMGRVLEISGTVQNIKIAGYVHDFVSQFTNSRWKEYNHKKKLNRYRKTDFAVGIIEGFRSKLEGESNRSEKDKEVLALVSTEDPLLKKYLEYKYPHTTNFRRGSSSQDENIFNDGVRLGKKMVLYKGITEKKDSKRLLTEKS